MVYHFHPFTFKLFVFFNPKQIFCRNHIVRLWLKKNPFANLGLLIGELNPFTFIVITGKIGFMSAFCFLFLNISYVF